MRILLTLLVLPPLLFVSRPIGATNELAASLVEPRAEPELLPLFESARRGWIEACRAAELDASSPGRLGSAHDYFSAVLDLIEHRNERDPLAAEFDGLDPERCEAERRELSAGFGVAAEGGASPR